ncbi:MAG: PIN domain-containing protein, partial [bacterium]
PITNSGSRAVLIDLDNCPKQIDLLHQALAGITRAVACYGSVEPKVQVGLVPLLAAAINEGKLEIVRMEKRGRNAADFGLAFWAGRLAAELPPETEFIILSQDGDLDHVVNLLRSAGRQVERLDGKTSKIEIASKPAAAKKTQPATITIKRTFDDFVADYCRQHLKTGKARPAKKTTLINSIKSCFKKHKEVNPEKVVQALLERGIIAIDGKGRVTYPEAALESPLLSAEAKSGELPF